MGPELTTALGSDGHGAGGAASACVVSESGPEQSHGCAAQHRGPKRAANQTQTGPTSALPVGGANCTYLRGVPADLPQLRGPDADNSGGTAAGAGLCLWGTFAAHGGDGGAISCEARLATVDAWVLYGQFWGHTWAYAVEFPIRFYTFPGLGAQDDFEQRVRIVGFWRPTR